jgi:TPR repeat protein
MNKKIYAALLVSLIGLNIEAMEFEGRDQAISGQKRSYEDFSEGNSNTKIPIEIVMPRNAVGTPAIEELDLNNEDAILLESFKNLIAAKHAKNDSYLLARTIEKIGEATFVQYLDAHAFNRDLFGQYPLLDHLGELGQYKHTITRGSIQSLDYYECGPQEKIFKFMCAYATLRSNNIDKRKFWRERLHANQEEDLELAAAAKYDLGFMYHYGRGVAVDYAKARQLYEQAASQMHDLDAAVGAKNNLGMIYTEGLGVEIDHAKAMQLYQDAANQTHNLRTVAIATNNLARMYRYGDGIAIDYAKAKELYEQVANQKHNLSVAAKAKNSLAHMYDEGLGVAVDYAKARELYEQVAKQKHALGLAARAKNNLGYMYDEGLGVAVNYAKARKLYEQAANQTHDLGVMAIAKNNLGALYHYGHGVAVNYAKAKLLYEQAANQTHDLEAKADAESHLAELEELMKKNA